MIEQTPVEITFAEFIKLHERDPEFYTYKKEISDLYESIGPLFDTVPYAVEDNNGMHVYEIKIANGELNV
jgi:hypothetical protein